MDNQYICRHLRRLIRLMYISTGSGFYARAEGDYFIFGAEKPKVENRVHRAVAIYIICTEIKNLKS